MLCIYFLLQSSATASPSLNTVTINSDAENISDNEDDHQKTHGSHISSSNNTTHNNTQYFKSLRYYLTRDALPSENHYRNLLSIGESKDMRKFSRPTLDELHECEEKGQLLEGQKHAMIIGKVLQLYCEIKQSISDEIFEQHPIQTYIIYNFRTLKQAATPTKNSKSPRARS